MEGDEHRGVRVVCVQAQLSPVRGPNSQPTDQVARGGVCTPTPTGTPPTPKTPARAPGRGGGDGDMRRGVNPGTVAKAASQYWAKMGKSHTGVESDFKMN